MARRYGVVPDIILGDLDSVSRTTRRHFRNSLTLYVGRQDNTDLEKALDYIAAHGGREVVILGATGRRIDFTLGNLSVVWNYTAFMDVALIGDGWRSLPVGRRRILRARRGTTVSLIPFGPCDGITLRGLQYPLTNASMKVGDIGVSNVVRSSPFSVSVRRGKMMLFLLDPRRRRAQGGR
jgi:thiamine pyrophosphokinase